MKAWEIRGLVGIGFAFILVSFWLFFVFGFLGLRFLSFFLAPFLPQAISDLFWFSGPIFHFVLPYVYFMIIYFIIGGLVGLLIGAIRTKLNNFQSTTSKVS